MSSGSFTFVPIDCHARCTRRKIKTRWHHDPQSVTYSWKRKSLRFSVSPSKDIFFKCEDDDAVFKKMMKGRFQRYVTFPEHSVLTQTSCSKEYTWTTSNKWTSPRLSLMKDGSVRHFNRLIQETYSCSDFATVAKSLRLSSSGIKCVCKLQHRLVAKECCEKLWLRKQKKDKIFVLNFSHWILPSGCLNQYLTSRYQWL